MALKACDYTREFDFIYDIVNRRIRKVLYAMGCEAVNVDRQFIKNELTRPIPLV